MLCSALGALPVAAATQTSRAPSATSTAGDFVATEGTELTLGGQPWKFAGYNLPCDNAVDLTGVPVSSPNPGSDDLTYYLTDIQTNSDANVLRVWFFQSEGGPGNWTAFDDVISDLQAKGMRAIVTLTNETSTCDEPDLPNATYKTVPWYQSGYQSPEGGYSLSFEQYAEDVAARYANNPTVAFWQLVNEAQAPTADSNGNLTCPDDAVASQALRSFADTMTAAIKSVDPNHLVDLGTGGIGGCGLQTSADYSYVHAGAVNLCEYHDYGDAATPMPAGLSAVVSDCNVLDKPTYIGEAGIAANVSQSGSPDTDCSPWSSCSPVPVTSDTLGYRAGFFQQKIQAANSAGLSGYVIWVKSPYYTTSMDVYAIDDGDPTEETLQSALQAYPNPPADVPEAPWAAALGGVALVVFGGVVALGRRRSRQRSAAPT